MAPVKISHVVSFSSQDPKYPVENLLTPDSQRGPWLSCPRDKSGQLKVELQLERAVRISYIDIGNCGCAFLQIDVGRSSWSLDRPFITLLPATMLMSLADSKQGKNRSGVRMFKDDDFLAPASGESWDRLRLSCSQPFTQHQPFGLAFLRVRSSLDALGDPVMGPSAPVSSGQSQGSSGAQESDPSPWLTIPSIRRTFFPDPPANNKEMSELKDFLKQLQPGALGRSARMVLSAARRAPSASLASPKNNHTDPGPREPESTEPRAEEQSSENNGGRKKRRKVQDQRSMANSNFQSKRRTPRTRQGAHRPQSQNSGVHDRGRCPICAGSFSTEILPLHAATCGETSRPPAAPPSSSLSSSSSVLWVSSPKSSPPVSWVQCPICQLHFAASEVEEHASSCGEALQD
ncbi:short transient receptor potential channel 2-like isoform X1 [Octodon degus]|uniref:Short transient receptor potential channel 2-like isoform X1 n=1 Tax=Octodon degus TaxID=10160 RepID=A0A6P3VDT2_OCTDE|nr:short transient receptor potential channel 2-like isoform X1 [Octodon degus]XP_023557902.1 short transient receptor potential channel 2-like isoform X1 [Octodon degus]